MPIEGSKMNDSRDLDIMCKQVGNDIMVTDLLDFNRYKRKQTGC